MFENLYNAMMFISYIDVKFLFNGSIVTNPIIEEIDFFQQYVLQQILETSPFDLNSLPNLKESKKKFKNLNEFYSEASEKVNKLLKNSNIIDTSININSTTIQIKECYNENDSYLVYLTCSKLNSFYDETIEIWYRKLGFEQFLNPNTPELMPPIDSSLVQNDGMQALNILRQETGWKKMDHIYIIYNGKQLNVDFILKGEINHMNFRIKKEHVTQLLRCRYTEIMKNYCVLLSSILHICNTVAYDFYYKCLIELFKSFNKSKLMVEGLYKSLITLNKSSIWSVSYSSYSILQKILKWVADIINLLNNNEFSQVYNDDLLDIKKIELVKRLLIVFLKFRDALRIELYSDLGYMKSRCLMKKSFYEMFQLIYDFKSSVSSIEISNFQWPIQVYHKACKFFNTFCENVYKSCYEDLGFKKVDCHNKSLDVKLHKFTVK
ncbi:uncharacterized protein LOC126895240 isoform X2 [Daktulosphaira vitifoliae]|nr:uncharacterized protein LOC126895240 isoform X2 [Daktulosphaira vitifoliae]